MPDKQTDYLHLSEIPDFLIRKYQTRGPRYTSYPTAPQFQTQFAASEITRIWRQSNLPPSSDLSIYIHIPFCRKRCYYCGCTTETGHDEAVKTEYITALSREMDRLQGFIDPTRSVRQIALGGGTPTSLNPGLMTRLIHSLHKRFRFHDNCEQSIEIDPRSVDIEYLNLLIRLGFRRFSFGIQDFDPGVQQKIGRVMDEAHILALIHGLRAEGISAINLDLMYGLPGQTKASFSETLDKVIRILPSRIALFGYAHVPWMSPHQKILDRYEFPDSTARRALFSMACDRLQANGYIPVGMDHFAREGDALIHALRNRTLTRNFMGYTSRRGLDLIGLGASAISSVRNSYTQNTRKVQDYISHADDQTWWKALTLSDEDVLRREIILELFCNFYLNIPETERRFGIEFARHFASEILQLQSLAADGLLELNAEFIQVSPHGRFFIRNICMIFDQYLSAGKFSKVI